LILSIADIWPELPVAEPLMPPEEVHVSV